LEEYRESWETSDECLVRLWSENRRIRVQGMLDISERHLYTVIWEAFRNLGVSRIASISNDIEQTRPDYLGLLNKEKEAIRRKYKGAKLTEEEVNALLILKHKRERKIREKGGRI